MAEGINSHTLDKAEANPWDEPTKYIWGLTVLTKVRKTTLHGLATQAQYICQHRLNYQWFLPAVILENTKGIYAELAA